MQSPIYSNDEEEEEEKKQVPCYEYSVSKYRGGIHELLEKEYFTAPCRADDLVIGMRFFRCSVR